MTPDDRQTEYPHPVPPRPGLAGPGPGRRLFLAGSLLALTPSGLAARTLTREEILLDRARILVLEFARTARGDGQDAVGKLEAHVARATAYWLGRARAVIIVPSFLRAGLVLFGGSGGRAVMLARSEQSGEWKSPAFCTLLGGLVGFQIGASTARLVLMLMTEKAVRAVVSKSVTLGGDLSVAVGPVGQEVSGATSMALGPDILAFAFSEGLFLGASVAGSLIRPDNDGNAAYYGLPVGMEDIILGDIAAPAAQPLRDALDSLEAHGKPPGQSPPPG